MDCSLRLYKHMETGAGCPWHKTGTAVMTIHSSCVWRLGDLCRVPHLRAPAILHDLTRILSAPVTAEHFSQWLSQHVFAYCWVFPVGVSTSMAVSSFGLRPPVWRRRRVPLWPRRRARRSGGTPEKRLMARAWAPLGSPAEPDLSLAHINRVSRDTALERAST